MSFLKKKKEFFLADLHKSKLIMQNLQEFFKVSKYFYSMVCFEGHILMAPKYL